MSSWITPIKFALITVLGDLQWLSMPGTLNHAGSPHLGCRARARESLLALVQHTHDEGGPYPRSKTKGGARIGTYLQGSETHTEYDPVPESHFSLLKEFTPRFCISEYHCHPLRRGFLTEAPPGSWFPPESPYSTTKYFLYFPRGFLYFH